MIARRIGSLALSAAAAAVAALGAACAAGAAEGPVTATDNVEARLVSAVDAAAPGETVWFGLHKIIRPHWHTYWRNPGDAGEPTEIAFAAPAGMTAGDFIWPTPEAISVEGVLVNYGYEGDLLLPFQAVIPEDAPIGAPLRIEANAIWLVCEEICIPEEAALTLDLPIATEAVADPLWGEALEREVAAAPRASGFDAGLARIGDHVRLTVADAALADALEAGAVRDPQFFPYSGEVIVHAAEQTVAFGARGIALDLEPSYGLEDALVPIDGVLTFEERRGGGWARQGVEIAARVGAVDIGAVSGGGASVGGSGAGLLKAIVFAFLGGLILNLMPCVFPVLSIKAFNAMRHAQGHRDAARGHGLAFAAGVLATFLGLAVALIVLRAAGAQIGWGFQLQSPLFVTFVALLFFAIGLNLLGVFEIGATLQRLAGGPRSDETTAGSFGVGALAVLAASPCTAPFMSAALPAALAAPVPIALAIFLALGAGFALPFTLLSLFPGWARALPKPGPWMNTLKHALALPMFAAAVWLLWVLSNQRGALGAGLAVALMAALGAALWAGRAQRRTLAGLAAGAFALLGVAVAGAYATGRVAPPPRALEDAEDAWSPERVAALRAEGRPVFVDFTAAWCITCQVNKRTALASAAVEAAFADTGTVFLTADWTDRDPRITAELARFDRAGVPLYLLYPARGEPIVLSELLTERQVLAALRAAAPGGAAPARVTAAASRGE